MASGTATPEDTRVITNERGTEVQLISVPREELSRTLIKKRAQWRDAKGEYGKAGQRVSALNDEMDAIIDEMERREAQAEKLPFDPE